MKRPAGKNDSLIIQTLSRLFTTCAAIVVVCFSAGCQSSEPPTASDPRTEVADATPSDAPNVIVESSAQSAAAVDGSDEPSGEFADDRRRMIERDLRGRDISDQRVLDAMARVPRHRFVPENLKQLAYADRPLPIGNGQTISQPYIVALMTQLVQPDADDRALDVGTGSGYQAAVLAELVRQVYSIEIVESLADEATTRLSELGYENVEVRAGDGYRGWLEHAPFDVIIVAAAPDHVPQPLIEQLAPGGRLVIPVGAYFQELLLIEKQADGSVQRKSIAPVAFVPMTGEAQSR